MIVNKIQALCCLIKTVAQANNRAVILEIDFTLDKGAPTGTNQTANDRSQGEHAENKVSAQSNHALR